MIRTDKIHIGPKDELIRKFTKMIEPLLAARHDDTSPFSKHGVTTQINTISENATQTGIIYYMVLDSDNSTSVAGATAPSPSIKLESAYIRIKDGVDDIASILS